MDNEEQIDEDENKSVNFDEFDIDQELPAEQNDSRKNTKNIIDPNQVENQKNINEPQEIKENTYQEKMVEIDDKGSKLEYNDDFEENVEEMKELQNETQNKETKDLPITSIKSLSKIDDVKQKQPDDTEEQEIVLEVHHPIEDNQKDEAEMKLLKKQIASSKSNSPSQHQTPAHSKHQSLNQSSEVQEIPQQQNSPHSKNQSVNQSHGFQEETSQKQDSPKSKHHISNQPSGNLEEIPQKQDSPHVEKKKLIRLKKPTQQELQQRKLEKLKLVFKDYEKRYKEQQEEKKLLKLEEQKLDNKLKYKKPNVSVTTCEYKLVTKIIELPNIELSSSYNSRMQIMKNEQSNLKAMQLINKFNSQREEIQNNIFNTISTQQEEKSMKIKNKNTKSQISLNKLKMKDISLANSQIVKDVDVKNKYKKK